MSKKNYTKALKFGDPYDTEEERLPYPVFEVLSQNVEYQRLAQVRYLAGKSHDEAPDAAEQDAFGAWNSASKAVDAFVSEWIADHSETLVDDYGIAEGDYARAYEEYHTSDNV